MLKKFSRAKLDEDAGAIERIVWRWIMPRNGGYGGVYFVSAPYEKSGSELTGKILHNEFFSLGTYFSEIGICFLI